MVETGESAKTHRGGLSCISAPIRSGVGAGVSRELRSGLASLSSAPDGRPVLGT
jgi:hypothetical protein